MCQVTVTPCGGTAVLSNTELKPCVINLLKTVNMFVMSIVEVWKVIKLKDTNILNESLLQPAVNNTNYLSKCSATTVIIMADILSTDTVKWHKTEECIQIYNLNFSLFCSFFLQIFVYDQGLGQTIPRPGRVNCFILFLRNDLSFCDVFRVLGFSMFNIFFLFFHRWSRFQNAQSVRKIQTNA